MMMSYINYPLHINSNGSVQSVNYLEHIKQLIEQYLFTIPGERVNRPEFGAGVQKLVFSTNSPEIESSLQFHLQAQLQQYFSELVKFETIKVNRKENQLLIQLSYYVYREQTKVTNQFIHDYSL